jgi:hypothetical protein
MIINKINTPGLIKKLNSVHDFHEIIKTSLSGYILDYSISGNNKNKKLLRT